MNRTRMTQMKRIFDRVAPSRISKLFTNERDTDKEINTIKICVNQFESVESVCQLFFSGGI